MTKFKATPKQFAQQLLNPLTKYDFLALYGNANTPEQHLLGEEFATECVNYSVKQIDGSIVNLVMITQKLMEVLSPLNDSHFKIGFDQYVLEVVDYFTSNSMHNDSERISINSALNVLKQVLKEVKRDYVTEFLQGRGYVLPSSLQTGYIKRI